MPCRCNQRCRPLTSPQTIPAFRQRLRNAGYVARWSPRCTTVSVGQGEGVDCLRTLVLPFRVAGDACQPLMNCRNHPEWQMLGRAGSLAAQEAAVTSPNRLPSSPCPASAAGRPWSRSGVSLPALLICCSACQLALRRLINMVDWRVCRRHLVSLDRTRLLTCCALPQATPAALTNSN